jgi:very-short-patch-repair endonuclease/predicted transcriptional regulator of viral defense system
VWSETPHNRGKVTTPPRLDAEIARQAARQHGVVTYAQLLATGLGRRAIEYRLRSGRLIRVRRGVYAIGHPPTSPLARAMAAVLACGPHALLSHHSAAVLWKMTARWQRQIHVTVPTRRRHPGIRVHRSTTLRPPDTTVHYGIPVTSPARTLLDLADTFDDPTLTRAVNEARLSRYLHLDDLANLLARSPGRATRRLHKFVDRASGPTRSEFEDAFLAFVDRFRLPRPEVNQIVAGYEVDMLWREQRLVVELDGRSYHEDGFELDRERDADLLAAGFPVVRVTWLRLNNTPAREATRLAALLRERAAAAAA